MLTKLEGNISGVTVLQACDVHCGLSVAIDYQVIFRFSDSEFSRVNKILDKKQALSAD